MLTDPDHLAYLNYKYSIGKIKNKNNTTPDPELDALTYSKEDRLSSVATSTRKITTYYLK
jgi:hypothetical protein